MNLTQAEAIATLYKELMESIDVTRFTPPKKSGWNDRFYDHKDIDSVHLEDGQILVKWSSYAGCGDYDRDETYHSLDTAFDD